MDESVKKIQVEGGDKEILYSKAIKAGKEDLLSGRKEELEGRFVPGGDRK